MQSKEEITYCQFMKACYSLPFDISKCEDCGGSGVVPDMCCNGMECGCMGLPVDYGPCGCGIPFPSDEKLLEVLEEIENEPN